MVTRYYQSGIASRKRRDCISGDWMPPLANRFCCHAFLPSRRETGEIWISESLEPGRLGGCYPYLIIPSLVSRSVATIVVGVGVTLVCADAGGGDHVPRDLLSWGT